MTTLLPMNETERLAVLSRYAILDTPPEVAFDRITSLAARLFNVPMALVSLVDEHREWFKSSYGFTRGEVARDVSFCTHIVSTDEFLVVPDARHDPRFADNPFVAGEPNIRFYAGAPLKTRDGFCLGSLCIIDQAARSGLSDAEAHTLRDLAAIVVDELELRLAAMQLRQEVAEREDAHEALRESEERFRQLTEALDDCVWISSIDASQVIYLSPAYETIWGRSRQEVEENPDLWREAIHPEDRERIVALWDGLTETPGEFNGEYRIVRPDGAIRWIWDRAFPIQNARGETYRHAGIASDITVQKQAEQEIHRLNAQLEQRVVERTAQLEAANRELKNEIAERRRVEEAARAEYAFRKAIEEANVSGVVAVDPTGHTFYVNPAFCRMVGWREDELLGEAPPYRYWPDDEIAHLRNALGLAMNGDAPHSGLEVRFRRSTGERFDALVLAASLQDAKGQLVGWIGSIYDITERKRAEAARQASERKYRLLMEQAADGIFVADSDGNYIEVNTEGCRMLGYTREEVLRLNMRDLIPAEDQARAPIRWSALQSGERVTSERPLRRKDGALLVAEINARRLDDGNLQAIVRDITRRKQAEARLRESERRLVEAQQLAHLGSWEWDIRSNQVTWSDEMYRIFGLQPRQFDVTYDAFVERVHPDDRASLNEDVQGALRDHTPYIGERRILRPDGTLRFFRTQVKVELDAHNQPVRLVGAAQDVTEQKEVELRLQREAARTRVLLRVAARLNQELDVAAVLNAVCEETSRVLDVPIASVALIDHERDVLVHAVGVGVPPEYHGLRQPIRRVDYEQITYPMDHFVVPDASALPDPPSREYLEALRAKTIVTMNIMRRGELVGILAVMTRDTVREFNDDELALLRGLADQAGQAITNAQLFEEIRATGVRMRQLSQQVVSVQEEERRRLSRELHDEAGQALTGLEISLKLIHADVPSSDTVLRKRISDAIALTGTTMDQIRLLAQDLRPPALDTIGLNLTIEGFCHSFGARTGLDVRYAGMEAPPLPDTINIALYRLLQEALTNVAKHADAEQICVALQYNAASITLSIADDGRGFDKRAVLGGASQRVGIGLVGMQERLEVLGGRLEIETEPGQGTRLVASVPLE